MGMSLGKLGTQPESMRTSVFLLDKIDRINGFGLKNLTHPHPGISRRNQNVTQRCKHDRTCLLSQQLSVVRHQVCQLLSVQDSQTSLDVFLYMSPQDVKVPLPGS